VTIHRRLLLVWLAWLLFFPGAVASAQEESTRGPGGLAGLGMVIGLVLIGLAYVLGRQRKK
jgi:hypothetical protein